MPERRKHMNKQMMSMGELEQVTGGNIFTDAWDWICDKFRPDDDHFKIGRKHTNCGGEIIGENHGVYIMDLWLTCSKCGKSWHPHSSNKIDQCEGI